MSFVMSVHLVVFDLINHTCPCTASTQPVCPSAIWIWDGHAFGCIRTSPKVDGGVDTFSSSSSSSCPQAHSKVVLLFAFRDFCLFVIGCHIIVCCPIFLVPGKSVSRCFAPNMLQHLTTYWDKKWKVPIKQKTLIRRISPKYYAKIAIVKKTFSPNTSLTILDTAYETAWVKKIWSSIFNLIEGWITSSQLDDFVFLR